MARKSGAFKYYNVFWVTVAARVNSGRAVAWRALDEIRSAKMGIVLPFFDIFLISKLVIRN